VRALFLHAFARFARAMTRQTARVFLQSKPPLWPPWPPWRGLSRQCSASAALWGLELRMAARSAVTGAQLQARAEPLDVWCARRAELVATRPGPREEGGPGDEIARPFLFVLRARLRLGRREGRVTP
jgi:hypothetical protein